ncbi:MAG TPA: hypothetical protein PLV32_09040, partial [Chitinophagaceae bacterium]|nr:hypothetical protein [Chitinophagaceae bacterium]
MLLSLQGPSSNMELLNNVLLFYLIFLFFHFGFDRFRLDIYALINQLLMGSKNPDQPTDCTSTGISKPVDILPYLKTLVCWKAGEGNWGGPA